MLDDYEITLGGSDLLAARRVCESAIIASAEDFADGLLHFGTLVALHDLAHVLDALGRVGRPVERGHGRLSERQVSALIAAARREKMLGADAAEHRWPEGEQVEAVLLERGRALDAIRVLVTLDAL